ncbi:MULTISPECIES: phenylalanine 4-monooxygenase [unclassified Rubrivivax]|uniref:phenylalanine 4-monooxygenase n=1 Tax=unclassified Rubrivivax TaxID=2649762 RepID=UPI001E4E4DED|nr:MULTISPECIES: phenylalanine 4-monooxygenase [unclassified Rubrivivax]MCC9595736.1 phenylalanine 4-monooxygenase [Rubrivivax sp. JA1055]MCC9646757.1 phenylalanine 4-monooxygenase [Rubrivivax sp. JA1029]MCD0420580.1 phenylalanine 4-monooxygenase [Rubrivivax sp. JA1024]
MRPVDAARNPAGCAPATYGEGERPPRGDYTRAGADYCCEQDWASYSEAEHALYQRLHARQCALLDGHACDAFVRALAHLGPAERIPRFERVSDRLEAATGWRLVAVPGLIPEEAFFSLLARRRFPVTDWLRRPEEFDYIVEPDLFHDLFGHVPLLFEPVFADFMQAYGAGAIKASGLGACELLARLYWYTVEFGLIASPDGWRAYGAGLLSSGSELVHAVRATGPRRLAFDVHRMMRSRYRIDCFQPTYFVIDSFEDLFRACEPDFTPLYERVKQSIQASGEIEAGQAATGDRPALQA